jgi:uncharacterized damage-inducible protein DinB
MRPETDLQKQNVEPTLLLAHLEYIRWATDKVLARVDQLPAGALTQPVESSFPTLLDTLSHVYGWHKYYFVHLQGDRIARSAVVQPTSYAELQFAWNALNRHVVSWAAENIAARKDVVLDGWGVWPAWMVVLQMASHATHHFGQVVTLLRQLGFAPERMESIDLIRYLLRRYPQDGQNESVNAMLERDRLADEAGSKPLPSGD